jgi:hypothetical protein
MLDFFYEDLLQDEKREREEMAEMQCSTVSERWM